MQSDDLSTVAAGRVQQRQCRGVRGQQRAEAEGHTAGPGAKPWKSSLIAGPQLAFKMGSKINYILGKRDVSLFVRAPPSTYHESRWESEVLWSEPAGTSHTTVGSS